MLMNLFILWCIASIALTIYGLVFCDPPLEELSTPVPEQKANIDPIESVPHQVDRPEVITEDTDWAA